MNIGPSDLRRWSEEVARDPGSPAFVSLAEAYRRQGRREAALRVCLRGLERNPDHVAAHVLLARLYLEAGDRARAADEWGIVLRLEPESFAANRGLGFYRLERGELASARRHLKRAARARPDDPTVREALAVLDERGDADSNDTAEVERPSAPPPAGEGRDPAKLFAELHEEAPFRGAVLVSRDGLALAGTLDAGGSGRAEAIGAVLADAIEEAVRTVDVLEMGEWSGLAFEAADARVNILSLDEGHAVVITAAPDAPAGWMIRVAERARSLARRFLQRDG